MNVGLIIVGCFALLLFEIPMIGAAYWFYKSRGKAMIKSRKPTVSLIFAFLVALHVAFLILVRLAYGPPRPDDCPWQDMVGGFFISGRTSAVSVRSYLLWFQNKTQNEKHILAQEMLILAKDEDGKAQIKHVSRQTSPTTPEFFLTNQRFTRWPYLVAICSWFFLWFFVPRIIATAVCEDLRVLTFMSIIALISVLIFLVSIFAVKEAFMIKFELLLLFLIIIFQAITMSLYETLVGPFLVNDLTLLLGQFMMFTMLIGFPLWLQKNVDRMSDDTSEVPALRLEMFLQDKKARQFFREYLLTEFSVENLYFWEAGGYHKQRPTVSGALRIYTTFIAGNAKSQVNVSGSAVSDVEDKLEQFYPPAGDRSSLQDIDISDELQHSLDSEHFALSDEDTNSLSEVFDKPLEEVVHLMETDTYQRFLASAHHKKYQEGSWTSV